MVRRRNPLFSIEAGVGPDALGVDWLHALSLGIVQSMLGEAMWAFISGNAWKIQGLKNDVLELSVARFKEELFGWCKTEKTNGVDHTRLQNFNKHMLGKESDKMFNVHGSESNGVLMFVGQHMLSRYVWALCEKRGVITRGIQSLVRLISLIKLYPRKFPPAAIQDFVSEVCVHMKAVDTLACHKPKHHMLIEMAVRLSKT